MSSKSKHTTILQKIGLALFVIALAVFIASLAFSHYRLDEEAVRNNLD